MERLKRKIISYARKRLVILKGRSVVRFGQMQTFTHFHIHTQPAELLHKTLGNIQGVAVISLVCSKNANESPSKSVIVGIFVFIPTTSKIDFGGGTTASNFWISRARQ